MKEITKQLENITRKGYDARKVFDDWLGLMLYSFLGNDKQYMQIMERYRNDGDKGKREADYFAYALAELLKYMAKTDKEVLGELYMQWEISNKYTGQFFTPYHIADMLSKMSGDEGNTISDPSCGSGVMLVAKAKNTTQERLDEMVFYGQDLDFACVKMCALNCLFFNLNSCIFWGNTLTMEIYQAFRTKRSYLGGEIYEVPTEELKQEGIEGMKSGQMSLLAA